MCSTWRSCHSAAADAAAETPSPAAWHWHHSIRISACLRACESDSTKMDIVNHAHIKTKINYNNNKNNTQLCLCCHCVRCRRLRRLLRVLCSCVSGSSCRSNVVPHLSICRNQPDNTYGLDIKKKNVCMYEWDSYRGLRLRLRPRLIENSGSRKKNPKPPSSRNSPTFLTPSNPRPPSPQRLKILCGPITKCHNLGDSR